MIIDVICELHGYIKNIRPRSYCNGTSMSSCAQSIDIEHSLHYMRQELTLPIASTERAPITFRRQAWYGGVIYIYNIVDMCHTYFVYSYTQL